MLPTFSDLESAQCWVQTNARSDPRLSGEVLLIIARVYAEDFHDQNMANRCAARAAELFDQCQLDTLEQSAARFVTILGKALPSYVHSDVVRWHFPQSERVFLH